jgi:flavin reductase (DIM6/NTAB) family NADH-FMN oxidoreductase RutF
MITIDPATISTTLLHQYLLGAITPRPIALVSSIDASGSVNLSPFSFFNVFGYNPPLVIFSPARRGRDNTTKHTYQNIKEVNEVVIHIVNYNMVQQTSLASTEYPKDVNEFVKAGFTPEPSHVVKPPRVAESPVAMECIVKQVIETGNEGGAGNLVLCEVVRIHLDPKILDQNGMIDPYALDAVARLGQEYYARIQGETIFSVPKPLQKLGIGFDALPIEILKSEVLTGNDLAMLANVESLPSSEAVSVYKRNHDKEEKLSLLEVHSGAKELIKQGDVTTAWLLLLSRLS